MTTNKNCSIQPYLIFNGRCEEAIEFYKKALGAEVTMLLRFKDASDPSMCMFGSENKVMYAILKIGGTIIFASDGRCEKGSAFSGFSLSLAVETVEDADRFFAALADGGQVQMPLEKTFFLAALRHGRRPFRHFVDGHHSARPRASQKIWQPKIIRLKTRPTAKSSSRASSTRRANWSGRR